MRVDLSGQRIDFSNRDHVRARWRDRRRLDRHGHGAWPSPARRDETIEGDHDRGMVSRTRYTTDGGREGNRGCCSLALYDGGRRRLHVRDCRQGRGDVPQQGCQHCETDDPEGPAMLASASKPFHVGNIDSWPKNLDSDQSGARAARLERAVIPPSPFQEVVVPPDVIYR